MSAANPSPPDPDRNDPAAPRYGDQDPYRFIFSTRKAIGAIILALIVLVGFLLSQGADSRNRADPVGPRFFQIGTGQAGGTYFSIGGVIASALSAPIGAPACEKGGSCGVPGLIAVTQTSEGSVANIGALAAGTIDGALVQADVAWRYARGVNLPEGEAAVPELRAVGRLFTETVHVVVRAESPARTVVDLAGGRVAVGAPGSGTREIARMLLDAHDMRRGAIDGIAASTEQAADWLLSGEIEAFVQVSGAPDRIIADLAERTPIRLLPVTEAEAAVLGELPFFTEETVPAGLYGLAEPVRTVGVGALLVVSERADRELVSAITGALWHPRTLDLVREEHPKGAEMSLFNALLGLGIPLHEGAVDRYRSLGRLPPAVPVPGDGTVAPDPAGAPVAGPDEPDLQAVAG